MAIPEPRSVLRMSTYGVKAASTATGVDFDELNRAVHRGAFPPDLADWSAAKLVWQFSSRKAHRAPIREALQENKLYLRGIDRTIATFTQDWIFDLQRHDARTAPSITRIVLWCCDAEPDALHASRMQAVEWCSQLAVDAEDTMLRWRSLYEWYQMLKSSGYAHTAPLNRTRLAVVAESLEDWPEYIEPSAGTK